MGINRSFLGVLTLLVVGSALALLTVQSRERLVSRPGFGQRNAKSNEAAFAQAQADFQRTESEKAEENPQSVRSVVESDELPPDEVSQVPSSTFLLEGVIHLAADMEIEGEVEVLCQAQRGNERTLLATIPVGPDTRWSFGPISLLLAPADQYLFQLQGENVVPEMVFMEAPNSGANVWVQLEAKTGIEVWMIVADENEKPLLEAEGVVSWFRRGGMRMERRARPRDDGMICVRGCPAGILFLEGHCPGYAVGRLDPLNLPEEPSYTRRITLQKAALVRGRCVFRGKPVPNFDVYYWPTRFQGDKDYRSFKDQDDGSFEIDAVPLGEITFLATSAEYINKASKVVDVTPSGVSEIELELCEPLRGVGRVLDMKTNEPIAEAEVQAFAMGDQGMVPWGPPRKVALDGAFDFRGFAPGLTGLRVWASAYSVTSVDARGVAGETVDFGVILMPRTQPLVVRLLSDQAFDPTIYSFAAIGAENTPEQPFPQSGILTIPSFGAGKYLFYLFFGETGMLRQEKVLIPGEDWIVEFPAGGFCRVQIEVVPEVGKDLPANHYVGYRRQVSGSDMVSSTALPENGRVQFDGIMPGEVGFHLHDSDGYIVANLPVSVEADDKELSFVLRLSAADWIVRVLDSEGEPVDGARVVMQPITAESWVVKLTNAQGECTFSGISPGVYRANIYHQARGTRAGIPVNLVEGSGEPIELILDATKSATVRLVQRGQPQEGILLSLYDESGFWPLTKKSSDANGIASFASLGEGRYLVRIMDPYWQADHIVEARSDLVPTELEVYGLGEIEFQVAGQGGLPVNGHPVELISLSLNTDVVEWVKESRIEVPEDGLVTDVHGLLRLQGVPRGDYLWRIPWPSGAVEGLATVVSGNLVRVPVIVP